MSGLFVSGREHQVHAVSEGQLCLVAQVTALEAVLHSGPKQDYCTLDLWAELSSIVDFDTSIVRIDDGGTGRWTIGGGYDRQIFRMAGATLDSPSRSWNSAEIRFGPFTSPMPECRWVIAYSSMAPTPFILAVFRVQGAVFAPGAGDSVVIPPGEELRPDLGLHARL
jgi:hypothetical protein